MKTEYCKWKSRKFLLTLLFFVIATLMVIFDKIDGLTYLMLLATSFGLYNISNGIKKIQG